MQSTLQDYCKTCPTFNPFYSSLALVLTAGEEGSGVRSSWFFQQLNATSISTASIPTSQLSKHTKIQQSSSKENKDLYGIREIKEKQNCWPLPGDDEAFDWLFSNIYTIGYKQHIIQVKAKAIFCWSLSAGYISTHTIFRSWSVPPE